jgi:hypothetical protein
MSRSAYISCILYAGVWAVWSAIDGDKGAGIGHLVSMMILCLCAFLHYGPEDSQKSNTTE